MMDSISRVELNPLKTNLVFNIFCVKETFANSWWVMETSTDGVHHRLGLNLSSERLVVDDDRWEKT